jgi:hypothetical protein
MIIFEVGRKQPQATAQGDRLQAYYLILQRNYRLGGWIGNAILRQLTEGGCSLWSLSSTTSKGNNKVTPYVSFHLNES